MHRVPVGKTLLIAGLCALIPLAGNVAASFLTEWTGERSWLVVPVVGVAVAMATALVQAYSSAPEPSPQPPSPDWPYESPARRGTSLPIALLVAVLVIGVGGLGLTLGARYVVGYVTGNEPGTERLRQPATGTSGGLTLTVNSVEQTAHFTRVRLVARNENSSAVSLPLFGNCVFQGGDGTTLEADSFRSRWSITLASGSLQRGTIIFKDHLPDRVRRARLSFAEIFGPSGGSISVTDLRLRRG